MRKYTIPQNMTVEYFLTDHLGSTNLVTDADGAKVSEMRYKPCPLRYTSGMLREGEVRYTWTASLTTTPAYRLADYTFTGQFSYMDDPSTAGVTEGFGLMFYNARWYDPSLGRFAQADSIVPGGVQGWDRYAYANNNSVKYVDPSGHMLDDGCNTIGCGEWKPKSDADKRNWAFTVMFKGSGRNDAWTTEDWNYYLDNQSGLWAGQTPWRNPDDVTGWELFALHTERLASKYSLNQREQFVRDFALVFAGMSTTKTVHETALYAATHGHGEYDYLNEGIEGLQDQYQDSNHIGENASHHYAGLFFVGYYGKALGGIIVNLARDADFWNPKPDQGYNPGDIALGNAAVLDGARFYGDPRLKPYAPMDVADWIRELAK